MTTAKTCRLKFSLYFLQVLLSLAFFCSCNVVVAQQEIPYGNNPAAGSYIMLNGVRHYYEVYGSGRPLLLIHGNATGTKGWAPQIPFFSEKYRVYSVDCRGRGKSDLGNDSLTFTQTASDLAAFIEVMKLDSVFILGKSDGAIVALLMAIYHPQHVSRIVAFAGNARPDSTALYPETLNEISTDRIHAEKMLAAQDTTKNWKAEQQRLRLDEFQPHIIATELNRIKIPVLIMSCDRDLIKPEHTLWIYKNIPLAHLCIVPGETHFMPRENPALFNETVNNFFVKPFMP